MPKALIKTFCHVQAAGLLAACLVIAACSRQDSCRAVEADAIVASAEPGCYHTVQQAIDAAPTGQGKQFVIYICPGIYKEKLTIPPGKGPIRLQGSEAGKTVLTYDASALPGGKGKFNTFTSASTTLYADEFEAERITFENSAGPLGQAVAINVSADRAAFRHCQFRGWRDTLLANRGRQYYEDCYVAGNVDFIFGAATAWFEHCELHCLAGGAITAASTPAEQPYGFVFSSCKITAKRYFFQRHQPRTLLGRPWGPYASVIYLNTEMAAIVAPAGWSDWNDVSRRKTVRFAEYHSSGRGAQPSSRVSFAEQLNDAQAASVTLQSIFGDWHPKVSPTTQRAREKN